MDSEMTSEQEVVAGEAQGRTGPRFALYTLLIAAGVGAIIAAFFLMRQSSGPRVAEEGKAFGSVAPDFTLKNLDGQFVSLRQFKGQPVLLFFWATW